MTIPASESLDALQAARRELLGFEPPPVALATRDEGGWRLTAASVRGPSHIKSDTPRQDAFAHAITGSTVVACVADGLGSQARSHIGSKLAAERVAADVAAIAGGLDETALAKALAEAGSGELGDAVRGAVCQAVRETERLMEMEPGPGFATTLVGVVAHPLGGFFFHVGDGVGLAFAAEPFAEAEGGDPQGPVVSPAENGEFDNITFAIGSDPNDPHLRFTSFTAGKLIVLMTDGPMAFTLGKDQASLAGGLFKPLSAHLWTEVGRVHGGQMLANVLNDPRAGEISDDDKTLLLLRLDD